jgi:hypothetical protein
MVLGFRFSIAPHLLGAVRPSQASREKLVSDLGRRGFDRMRSPRAATMIALASATGQARTLPASRTGAGGMMPARCSSYAEACGSVPPASRCNIARLGGVSRTG